MKGKRLLILGAAFALGLSACASATRITRMNPLRAVGDETTLTFDVTSNPGQWPTANSTTLTDYTYSLNGSDYTFSLKNVKQNSGYLMLTSTAVLGLPAINGSKLTKVVASNSAGCSTSTKVGISSASDSASYISGGDIQTWSTASSSYTYNLSDTISNTQYYLYVTNRNAQITELKLTYSEVDGTPTPSTYTVTYNANGGTGTMVDEDSPYDANASVTVLDNTFVRDGYAFTCWNTKADGTGTDYDEGAQFSISANTTLYAQWEEDTTGIAWVYTPINSLISTDKFVIIGNNGNNYAMSNNNGTSSAPSAVVKTVSNGRITGSVAESLRWNISGDADDEYIFYPDGSTATWLYCIANNNGLRVGTGDAKTFSINSSYLFNNGQNRYIGVYNNSDWRSYTSINSNIENQTFAFYRQAQDRVLSSIVLSGTYQTTFTQGDTFSSEGLTVSAQYEDGTSEDVTARVSLSGYNLMNSGEQTVTVSYVEGLVTKTQNYDINVNATTIHATGISLDKDSATLLTNQSIDLVASVTPTNTTDSIEWSSSDEDVATIEYTGLNATVTAVAEGSAIITATINGYSADFSLTVETLTAANIYTGVTVNDLLAEVVAVNGKNAMLDDGTAGLWTYSSADVTAEVGDVVKVNGTVTNYNGGLEVASAVLTSAEGSISTLSAQPISETEVATEISSRVSSNDYFVSHRKISLRTGIIGGSDSHLTWSYGDSLMETTISTGNMEVGNQYDIEGYLTNFYTPKNSADTYLCVCVTSAVLVEKTISEQIEELETQATLSYNYTKEGKDADELDASFTGVSGNSYSSWSNKTGASGAVYAGQSAVGYSSIQLRSNNNNSGIITTTSGGNVTKVTVSWNSETEQGRTINIYGRNSAYSSPTDLYSTDNQEELLGTIICGTSTELAIEGDYAFIGIRSASGALYLDSIRVQWGEPASFAYSSVAVRFGGLMQKDLWDDLAKETTILGYGVLFAPTDDLSGDSLSVSNAQYDLFVDSSSKEHPSLANDSQKGELDGDYYIWNLRVNVSEANYKISMSAVAYIKTSEGYIYLQQYSTSVKDLAADYLTNRGYDSDVFEGSLYDLAHLA